MSSRNRYEQIWENEVVNFETHRPHGENSTYEITARRVIRHSPGNKGIHDDQVENDDPGKLMCYLKEDSALIVRDARARELQYLQSHTKNMVVYLHIKTEKNRVKMLVWVSDREAPVTFYGYIQPKIGRVTFDFFAVRNQDNQMILTETHLGHQICAIEGQEGNTCGCEIS